MITVFNSGLGIYEYCVYLIKSSFPLTPAEYNDVTNGLAKSQ